jgi:hypothetical protein
VERQCLVRQRVVGQRLERKRVVGQRLERQRMVQQRMELERLELGYMELRSKMTQKTRIPRSAIVLIASVVTAGTAAVAMRLPEIGRWTNTDLLALAAIAAVSVLGEAFSVQVRFGRETKHVTLTEAAYAAALLLGVRAGVLTAAVAIGITLSYAARGTARHKVVYNAASYALAVTAAEVVFHSMAGVSPLAAIAVAMGAFFAVNSATIVGVIALATGKSFGEVFRPIAKLEGSHAVGNLTLGTVSAAIWMTSPTMLPLVLLASALVLSGYRALSPAPPRPLAR